VENISVRGGTLVDYATTPIEVQRQEVVQTISTVNEGNPSVKGGSLVVKRIGEAVDVIQGGLEAMGQQPKQPTAPDPDRPFYQSFREGITPPTQVQTQVPSMVQPQAEEIPVLPETTVSPEFKTTEQPIITQPEDEESPAIGPEPPLSKRGEVPPVIVDESSTFSTLKIGDTSETISNQEHMTTMFDGLKDVEGEESHVDGRGYFTMAYGVVPDADSVTKADGTKFDPKGTHGYTTDTAGTVDVSKATHTLEYENSEKKKVSFTVKREDYDSEKSFAKAVVSLYNRESKKMYGDGWDSLPDSAKSMALDLAWNGGVGAVGWNDTQTAMKEAAKDSPSTENMFLFTRNFRSGTEYPRGLFKRRLIQYNIIANEADKAATYSTEAINDAQGKRIGTKYIANRSDGTEIGSYSRTDKAEDPKTKAIELRTPSKETIEANVSLE